MFSLEKCFRESVFLIALSCSLFAQAERIEYQMPDDAGLVSAPNTMAQLDEVKNKKGWANTKVERADGTIMYVVTGVGSISAPQDSPNYINSRQNAFDKAMLDAKTELAQFFETEIGGEINSRYEEPSNERQKEELLQRQREGLALSASKDVAIAGAEDLGLLSKFSSGKVASDKAKDLLVHEIDLKLMELGYDPNMPIDQQSLKKVQATEEMSKAISAVAKTRVVGLQAFKVIENTNAGDHGEIGVIAVWSPKLNAVADAVYTGDISHVPRSNKGKKSFVEQIPADPLVLMTTFGVRQFVGPDGEYGLMSFAQAAPRANNSRSLRAAQDKAKLQAMFAIRLFAGESVKAHEVMDRTESLTSYADKMGASEFDESYLAEVSSKAEAINITGMQGIKYWSGTHPINNHPVAGAVVLWTPSDSQSAGEAKKEMNNGQNFNPASSKSVSDNPFNKSYNAGSQDADEDAF